MILKNRLENFGKSNKFILCFKGVFELLEFAFLVRLSLLSRFPFWLS